MRKPSEYFTNAAKMIPWQLNIEDRFISVPEPEIEAAKDNLVVRHLIKEHKFFIQSSIPYQTKKPFEPVFRERITPARLNNDPWAVGAQFQIKSSGVIIEITQNGASGMKLKYVGQEFKNPIVTNEAQADKMLKIGSWIRVC